MKVWRTLLVVHEFFREKADTLWYCGHRGVGVSLAFRDSCDAAWSYRSRARKPVDRDPSQKLIKYKLRDMTLSAKPTLKQEDRVDLHHPWMGIHLSRSQFLINPASVDQQDCQQESILLFAVWSTGSHNIRLSVLTPIHCPFSTRFFGGDIRSNEESKKTERCLERMRRLTTERDNEFMVYSSEINNLTAQSL